MKSDIERKWVIIEDHDGEKFCTGIFDTLREAVGKAYTDIAEFAENYQDEGEEFSVTTLQADDYGGYYIIITFRAACWSKPCSETYYLLQGPDKN